MPGPADGVLGPHNERWVQAVRVGPPDEEPTPPPGISVGPPNFGHHVRPAPDAGVASWILPALDEVAGTVGDLMPGGYESYLFVDDLPSDFDPELDDRWDMRTHTATIAEVASRHTATPDRAYFAVWEGHGYSEAGLSDIPRLVLPIRSHYLLVGEVGAASKIAEPSWWGRWDWQQPDLWWPQDRAWFVGTDVDLECNYVAGPEAFTAAVAAAVETETHPVNRSDRLERVF